MTHSSPTATAAPLTAVAGVLACLLVLAGPATGADVALTVRADKVVGQVDEKVYGQFLEHIYHSVNGGLWGEMVWDRTFEGGQASSRWAVADGCLMHEGHAPNTRLMFGDPKWTDYEFTLEARKIDGGEGFLVLFRETSKDDFYWANLGGWQNKRHGLERGTKGEGRWRGVGKTQEGSIEAGKWYRIRVRCEGAKIQVFLDDAKVLEFTDEQGAHLAGRVGVGTWETSAAFRNLKVTSLDGKVLFEGLPKNVPPANDTGAWTTFGQGQFERTKDNPLNGEFCQLVAPAGSDEAGIRQRPFCIRAGETYHGSLWARGQAGGLPSDCWTTRRCSRRRSWTRPRTPGRSGRSRSSRPGQPTTPRSRWPCAAAGRCGWTR
jgi:alpha-N-arabinofuranosidase